MSAREQRIETERFVLRNWTDEDRDAFAAMNADDEVMADMGGPISRAESDSKLDRYAAAFESHGYGRWLVEGSLDGEPSSYLGYVGVMPNESDGHPLGRHDEIGWRLCRRAWGHGVALEAATAALRDLFARTDLERVLSYTSPTNLRSQAVMSRLGLRRDESLDFEWTYEDVGAWQAMVWVAIPTTHG